MRRLAPRRISAFLLDVVGILLCAGLLALLVGLPLVALAPGLLLGHPVAENVVGLLLLVVPVTLGAAGLEHRLGATPGKRLLGLRVHDRAGAPLPLAPALLRNALKLALPWSLGHLAVFALVSGAPDAAPPLPIVLALLAAYALPLSAIVLLLTMGRPLHDLASGAVVVPVARGELAREAAAVGSAR